MLIGRYSHRSVGGRVYVTEVHLKMACSVADLVHESIVSLEEHANVQQAAALMAQHKVGSLVVTSEGRVAGLFTEQDLVRRVVGPGKDPNSVILADVCTRNLLSVPYDSKCLTAMAKMQAHRCRRLLVFRGNQFLGLVSLTDLAHAIAGMRRGNDLVVNVIGAITLAVAVGVIAILLLQLPEMLQLAEQLSK